MKLFIALIMMLFIASPVLAAKELKVGEVAPDFTLNTLKGTNIILSGFKGKLVVIGFVDNCEPCVAQAEELEKLRMQYSKNPEVVVMGIVSQDKSGTNKLLQQMNPKAGYPLVLDPKISVQKAYGLRGDPQIVIVNTAGNIAFKSYTISAKDLALEVEKLLK